MARYALGLMSGTSADGVSLALADFSGGAFRLAGYKTYSYPTNLAKKIASAARFDAAGVSSLNFELGQVFGSAAARFLRSRRIALSSVAVIGSHGQTIYHGPGDRTPSTLQIGEAAVIAEKTGVTVVSDFRPADIAAGGQGAPLLPFFDEEFFGDGPARILLNIGGIANVALAGKNAPRLAFDTGPGNCLIDEEVRRLTRGRQSFDRNGALALRGRINAAALSGLLRHSYFRRSPPKSTGRELFNVNFLPGRFKRLPPLDRIATLTEFTARTIADAHKRFVFPRARIQEVIISGGGAFNRTLVGRLRVLLAPAAIRSIAEFGIHPQAKEPLAFAYFAWRAVRGRINHAPEGTGARGARILGNFTPGRRFRGVR